MYPWFIFSILGMCLMVPLHFLSVEHLKFQKKFGMEKGNKITTILGLTSGWGFFAFWFGIWISTQPRLIIPFISNPSFSIPIINFSIPVFHLIISIPFIIVGAWFGIGSVRITSLKVAETHRTERIVSTKIYSLIRHPQYFGFILIITGWLVGWPTILTVIFAIILIYKYVKVCRVEEEELAHIKKYEDYKEKVPFFI